MNCFISILSTLLKFCTNVNVFFLTRCLGSAFSVLSIFTEFNAIIAADSHDHCHLELTSLSRSLLRYIVSQLNRANRKNSNYLIELQNIYALGARCQTEAILTVHAFDGYLRRGKEHFTKILAHICTLDIIR